MFFAVNYCRRVWRRTVRAYHLICAREDAAGHGLTVPSGVWRCLQCELVMLERTAFREHLRVAHSMT